MFEELDLWIAEVLGITHMHPDAVTAKCKATVTCGQCTQSVNCPGSDNCDVSVQCTNTNDGTILGTNGVTECAN